MRADEIDGAGDPAPGAFGHHQDDPVAHFLADQRIERPREIGPTPFARSGFHIELEEGIPYHLGEVAAAEPMHGDAVFQRLVPLATDGFAFARRQRGEEIVKACETLALPVKLLVGALQIAEPAEELEFRLGRKGHMHAGSAAALANLDQAAGERALDGLGLRAVAHQEAAAGRRRERYGDLQLRIIAAAGALIGLGPAAVEHVFTARVALEIAGRRGNQGAIRRFCQHMPSLPARSGTDRLRIL